MQISMTIFERLRGAGAKRRICRGFLVANRYLNRCGIVFSTAMRMASGMGSALNGH
jgi:hypothetical protein